jgi:TonB family protein
MRMTSMAALSAGVILLGGPTAAQTPPAPPRPSVITTPNWASIPSGEDMAAAYPEFANAIGQDGDVTLRCAALASGSLERCEIVETTPVGLGFDRAGLSLSSRFRVSPLQVDGEEAKSIVQFTIRFRARPFDPVLPWTGPEPDAAHLAATRTMIDGVSADVERDFQRSLQDLDVDADRRDKVRAILVQVHQEFAERHKAAATLAMARLVTPQQLAAFLAGGAPPPEPADESFMRAGDQSQAASQAEMERIKVLYCAQFDCPALAAPPAGSVQP